MMTEEEEEFMQTCNFCSMIEDLIEQMELVVEDLSTLEEVSNDMHGAFCEPIKESLNSASMKCICFLNTLNRLSKLSHEQKAEDKHAVTNLSRAL